MPLSNTELLETLEKAQLLTGDGGQVSQQEAEEFIELSVDQTAILKTIRTEPGIVSSYALDSLALGEPVTVGATEATAPAAADITKPVISRKVLQPREVIAGFDVSYSFLRKNIERGKVNATLNALFAKRFGKDIVIMAFSGDTAALADTRLNKARRVIDGFVKQADAAAGVHDVALLAADPMTGAGGKLSRIIDALPADYQDPTELGFFLSHKNAMAYLRELQERGTSLGDRAVTDGPAMPFEGIPLYIVFGMADNKIILTPTANLAVGYGINLTVESMRKPRERMLEVTMTAEVDAKIVVDDAVSLGTIA